MVFGLGYSNFETFIFLKSQIEKLFLLISLFISDYLPNSYVFDDIFY
jgi:hypothetical protein